MSILDQSLPKRLVFEVHILILFQTMLSKKFFLKARQNSRIAFSLITSKGTVLIDKHSFDLNYLSNLLSNLN